MNQNKLMKISHILLSGFFVLLSVMNTVADRSLRLFPLVCLLFLTGILLEIISERKQSYRKNIGKAVSVCLAVFCADVFLKWIMMNEQTMETLHAVLTSITGLYPLQTISDPVYRTLLPVLFLFFAVLFQPVNVEEEKPSLLSALLCFPGDNLAFFLTAHVLVSTFPVYWNGSHPVILRLFYDLVMGTVLAFIHLMYRTDPDGVSQKAWDVFNGLMRRTFRLRTVLFGLSFGYLFFYHFFNTTMFPVWLQTTHPGILPLLDQISTPMILLSALLAFGAMADADQKYEKNIITICLLLGFVFYGNSQNGAVYTIFMFTAGAVKRDARGILLLSFIEGLVLMLLAWLGVSAGILEDIRVSGYHSLGIIYSTDCCAHWFYLFAAYCLIRRGKFHIIEYAVSLLFFTILYWLTGAETGYFCFLLVWGIMLLRQYVVPEFPSWEKRIRSSRCFVWSYVIFAVVIFLAIRFQNVLTPFLKAHYYSLWQRLYYSREGLQKYPVRFLSQVITEHGNGLLDAMDKTFFYLDVSYVRILLMDGILVFGYIIGICTWFLWRARKKGWWILFGILVVIALQSMVEQRLPEYWYNVLIVLPLADFHFLEKQSC